MDALPERVTRFSTADRIISSCSASWAAARGLTPSEVIGRTLAEFLMRAELVGMNSRLAHIGPDNPHTMILAVGRDALPGLRINAVPASAA